MMHFTPKQKLEKEKGGGSLRRLSFYFELLFCAVGQFLVLYYQQDGASNEDHYSYDRYGQIQGAVECDKCDTAHYKILGHGTLIRILFLFHLYASLVCFVLSRLGFEHLLVLNRSVKRIH